MERLAGADLEVVPAPFVLDGAYGDQRSHRGALGAGPSGGGRDVIPRRPRPRTADKKVATAGRPDAVGV